MTIFNGIVNIIFYDAKDVLPLCLNSISQNDYNTFSSLHIPTKEHDNIVDENNQRESIESSRSFLIRTQDITYD